MPRLLKSDEFITNAAMLHYDFPGLGARRRLFYRWPQAGLDLCSEAADSPGAGSRHLEARNRWPGPAAGKRPITVAFQLAGRRDCRASRFVSVVSAWQFKQGFSNIAPSSSRPLLFYTFSSTATTAASANQDMAEFMKARIGISAQARSIAKVRRMWIVFGMSVSGL